MPCETCGEPTTLKDSGGGTTSGPFTETYECANGHRGTVAGDAGKSPRTWTRTGAVFNNE